MDQKSLFQLSYGLYIISTSAGGVDAGCVVNTLQQVTGSPPQLSVAVNKENYTGELIGRAGKFCATVLTQDVDMELVRVFGFQSSRDTDKFTGRDARRDEAGLPYLTGGMAARFRCDVSKTLDVGSHVMYVGEVREGEILSGGEVMTYAYYHQVKNGITPPKASSYQPAEEKKGWRCTVCGYVYEGDPLPGDFVCPVCGVPASKFERIA